MKVVVVGAGITGKAVAKYYKKKGAEVVINDVKKINEFSDEERREIMRIGKFIGGGHTPELFVNADKVVVSPGVPKGVLSYQRNVVGDIEDAYREIDGRIIGITGTNGKTITTLFLTHLLTRKGFTVFTGGNVGRPYIDAYGSEYDYIVLELSSFQLEWIESFRPWIGILLNVSQDHMDRYTSYDEYLSAKLNMFVNQGVDDHAIINADIRGIDRLKGMVKSSVLSFSVFRKLKEGVFLVPPNYIVVRVEGEKRFKVGAEVLRKVLSYENLFAVLLVGTIFRIHPEDILEGITEFIPPPHRLSYLTTKCGMRFYDDSKATNPSAVLNALRVLQGPILLLLGGRNKNLDFDELFSSSEFTEKVKKVIAFGEAGEQIAKGIGECIVTKNLKEAVLAVKSIGEEGDNVLLSPGCASFDEFMNYEERGRRFAELVEKIFNDA